MNTSRFRTISIYLALFLLISVSLASTISSDESSSSSRSTTLYVGGRGPGNYSTIQSAIDNASNGDTIYVSEGIYYENVRINKSLTLTGETRDNTIIDAKQSGCPVVLATNGITIDGFTLQNSGGTSYNDGGIHLKGYDANDNIIFNNKMINNYDGIVLYTDNNKIYDNIILNNRHTGIYQCGSSYNDISGNYIENNSGGGIHLFNSDDNDFHGNYITHNHGFGVRIWESGCNNRTESNKIYGNIICNMSNGISIAQRTGGTQIYNNSIENNTKGVVIGGAQYTIVKENNFQNNKIHATFEYEVLHRIFNKRPVTQWVRNYWDDKILPTPKIIRGKISIPILYAPYEPPIILRLPAFNIDWSPSAKPYII